jgi:hypothetical protein
MGVSQHTQQLLASWQRQQRRRLPQLGSSGRVVNAALQLLLVVSQHA